jgi:hypothetical protein
MQFSINKKKRSGQAMLIAVLSLGGAILGATAIAGFLTLYQIRTTTDSENSAKAIFAADSGTEWALLEYYCAQEGYCPGQAQPNPLDYPPPSFSNGSSVSVNCYSNYSIASGTTVLCSDPTAESAISTGISAGSERAFFLDVTNGTTTYP